jgi:GMP synthase-like glutamine amidotransferase
MFADEAAVPLVGAFFTATARSACLLVATCDDLLLVLESRSRNHCCRRRLRLLLQRDVCSLHGGSLGLGLLRRDDLLSGVAVSGSWAAVSTSKHWVHDWRRMLCRAPRHICLWQSLC